MAQETHVSGARRASVPVLPMEAFPTGVACRRILESRAPCQQCHALCATSASSCGVQQLCSLTEMKVKTGIQPENPIRLEDVSYSGSGTWRFGQLDPLFLCNRVFQLPSNLTTF